MNKRRMNDFVSNLGEKNDSLEMEGTGSKIDLDEETKIIEYPFDRYLIKVELTSSNEFLGIIEIKINRDFRSFRQIISKENYHKEEDLYLEE